MKKKLSLKNVFSIISKVVVRVLVFFLMFSVIQILYFTWNNPVTTSIITQRQFDSFFSQKNSPVFHWTDYNDISKMFAIAVVAAEDQSFKTHFGFDFEQINKAFEQSKIRGRLRGASTITQQVAKNLFLWEGRSFIRKGFEAYYTLLIELIWSKKRILEMYLNIAEMGDNAFGVGEASKIYYNKLPKQLTQRESVSIAATLPNPQRYSVLHPSTYIIRRQEWILNQINLLGGTNYLDGL